MAIPFDNDQFRDAFVARHGFTAKPFQVDATRHLATREDVLVIAHTGAGKSALFTSLFLLPGVSKDAMVVIITPLKALQVEQTSR
jgi:superfamily II RNA helicase